MCLGRGCTRHIHEMGHCAATDMQRHGKHRDSERGANTELQVAGRSSHLPGAGAGNGVCCPAATRTRRTTGAGEGRRALGPWDTSVTCDGDVQTCTMHVWSLRCFGRDLTRRTHLKCGPTSHGLRRATPASRRCGLGGALEQPGAHTGWALPGRHTQENSNRLQRAPEVCPGWVPHPPAAPPQTRGQAPPHFLQQ